VLNGDILSDIDLSAQLERHAEMGARATLALTPVEDPSAYGLVRTAPDGEVTEFLEKPSADSVDTNLVSAGAYVLERDVLELMPDEGPCSIERDVFPVLIGAGLYAVESTGYWLDIGTPERYLKATFDILEGEVDTEVRARLGDGYLAVAEGVESDGRVVPPALVQRGCRIASGARVGARVVLGPDVSIGAGTRVEESVVMGGSEIGPDCQISSCIVAAGVRVGPGCTVQDGAVLGEGVTLGAGNTVAAGARIFPGVELPEGAITF
jgi:mannose-1-phosphate guanylyltransferase